MDHAEILGDSLAAIAGEKAGIIKSGVPNLTGKLPAEAYRVVSDACRKRKAPLVKLLRKDYSFNGSSVNFHSNGLRIDGITPGLPGKHQLLNCSLALKAIAELRNGGFRVSDKSVVEGLKNVFFPGRFQIMQNGSASPKVILDVCHNQAGARAFAESFAQRYAPRKALVLIGLVKRKQHQEMIDVLAPIAKQFHLIPLSSKRSCDPKEISQSLKWHNVPVTTSSRLETAWRRLLKMAVQDDIISVIGSHYLVGEFLKKRMRP